MDADDLVQVWRRIIAGPGKSWVLFAHGTVVVLTQPEEDLAARATEILREFGPVHVAPDELGADPDPGAIGLVGRGKRDQDGHELTVVHVEDQRQR